MPRFDGTGPLGKGPKTGRGLGSCRENMRERELAESGEKVVDNVELDALRKKIAELEQELCVLREKLSHMK